MDNDVHQINEDTVLAGQHTEGFGPGGNVEARAPFPIDDGVNFIMEDATDPNTGASAGFTFENIGNYTNANDRIISEKSVVVTANIVMDSSEDSEHVERTDAGGDILIDGINESHLL